MKTGVLLAFTCLLLVIGVCGCSKTEKTITCLDDAATATIGVMTGTTGEAIAKALLPKARIKSFDDVMDAVAAIKSGQLDAVVTAYPTAFQVEKLNPDLRTLAEPLKNEDSAVAVRKGNDDLLAALNGIIGELKADGTLEDLKTRWFKKDLSPYKEKEIVLPTTGKVLKIGVCATREPLSFVDKNGRISGHDGELARIIAARLHRPVEFQNMKFMALIPALKSGKVDLILSGMAATPERRKSIDFTHPYFANAQVMLVKKGTTQPPAALTSQNSAAISGEITSLQQLEGKKIGILTGSAGDGAARVRFPHATFQNLVGSADAALAVKSGKIDGFVYDKSVLLNIANKNNDLVILDEPVSKLGVAAVLNKKNTALLAEMNGALQKLDKRGALAELKQKWVTTKYTVVPKLPPVTRAGTQGVLKMGTSALFEPFTFKSNGTLTGLDIELGQLLGELLGKQVEIVDMSFDALIPALQAGKIDFALSDFNVTEERKKLVNFSVPYIENDISALVRRSMPSGSSKVEAGAVSQTVEAKSNGAKLTSADDLKDKRIGVLLGSVHDTYATKQYPRATILQYKSPSDLTLAVKSGKVDAAFYTHETLLGIVRNDNELAFLGKPLFSVPIGMGFNKSNEGLKNQFNELLRQIRGNGVFNDMVSRWITTGNNRMPEIAATKTDGVLVVGTVSDKGLPFTVIKDNKMIGFDIELAQRFAAYLGKELKLMDMEFGSLIAAAATNKIDMIASTLMITEERKQQVAFSDPYYELGASVFALKNHIAAPDGAKDTAVAREAAPSFLAGVSASFNSNIIQEKRYLLILDGLKTTVVISVFATVFGTLLGALVCFMRMSKRNVLNLPARLYIAILRGTPVLVLLMLIFYVVFASVDIDPVVVAVIAFGMNFAAYTAEIFRTGIEGVDKGQTEAGIAMGFTKVTTFLNIVLPQTIRRILPVFKGEFISLVKMTSIVGYIAVQDLTKASDIIRSRTFDAFFPLVMVAILYFLISWLLMQSLEYVERVTDPKYKRRKAGIA